MNDKKILGVVLAVAIASPALVAIDVGYKAWETHQMMEGLRIGLARQIRQAERVEAEAAFREATSDFAESVYLAIQDSWNLKAQTESQTLIGEVRQSTMKERATEVGAPVDAFLDQPVTLLVLESPASVFGFDVGSRSYISERSVSVIRIPDDSASDGETVGIELDEAACWPSDISGMLWDLDATNQQSVRVIPHS